MKVVRDGVFETNSSSVHSVSVRKNEDINYLISIAPEDDGYVHVKADEFGWEFGVYDDIRTKLSYIVTMIAEANNIDTNIEDIEATRKALSECEEWNIVENAIIQKLNCKGLLIDKSYGYIDHQSQYESVASFLDDWQVSLDRYLFDRNVTLNTSNDNF